MSHALSIVHVNTNDDVGGAARVARDVHDGLLRAGEESRLVVGLKRSADTCVGLMDNDKYRNPWSRFWLSAKSALEQNHIEFRGKGRLGRLLTDVALPERAVAVRRGVDYFGYPAAWHPEDWSGSANLVHLHNLHGEYFDLRALPMLSKKYPTVLTLHDAWLLAGHCAHSLGCEAWRTGCGGCPDLSIPPTIRRDRTAPNWQMKREVFAASKLYVSTPSRWLMDKVETSILAPAVSEARVIPNGVDLEVFKPQDRQKTRAALGLSASAHILVFAANAGTSNPWKDFSTIRAAAVQAAEALDCDISLIVIGGQSGYEQLNRLRIEHIGYVSDRHLLASYLAAADLCVNAVRAESFSLWLAESLACGRPAVCVRVGGIPEVVQDGITGLVVPPGDVTSFTRALVTLLRDEELRARMGNAASEYALAHLGLRRMVDDYRRWYQQILDRRMVRAHETTMH